MPPQNLCVPAPQAGGYAMKARKERDYCPASAKPMMMMMAMMMHTHSLMLKRTCAEEATFPTDSQTAERTHTHTHTHM